MSANSAATTAPEGVIACRHTGSFLIVFYMLAIMWGLRNTYQNTPSALDLLVPVSLAFSLGWWAIVDARLRHSPIPFLSQSWFVLLAAFVVPAYAIWSRRWAGLGWVALHVVIWLVLATASMQIGAFLIYGQP